MYAFPSSPIFRVLSVLTVGLSLISCGAGTAPPPNSENNAPVFQGQDIVLGPENRPFSYRLAATDKDGDALVYNIVGGDDAKLFHMDSLAGEVSTQQPFNYEKPHDADGDGRFELVVSVSDLINPPAVRSLSIIIGDEQNLAPSLIFPSDQSQLGRVDRINVIGRLVDLESGEEKSITEVQSAVKVIVNDVEATFDSNHAGLWSATIPVHQGKNTLNLSVTDARGIERSTVLEVFSRDHILASAALAMNPQSGLFYIADNVNQSIYSYSAVSGEALVVVNPLDDELVQPSSMHLDPQGKQLAFLGTGGSSVFIADLDRDTVSAVIGGESTLDGALDMTMDWAQNRAFVVDAVGVATVDLATGALQYIYEFTTDNTFTGMNSIIFDASQQRLLFIPSFDGQELDTGVYALDIDTATVTLVAADDGDISSDTRIAAFDGGDRVWIISYNWLREVNLQTGERHFLQYSDFRSASNGSASSIIFPSSTQAIYDEQNQRLLFADNMQPGIYAHDLISGEYSKLADPQQPAASGERIQSLRSLAVDLDQERAIGIDGGLAAVWSISLKDGTRTKLLELATGEPDVASSPISAKLDASGENLYFLELLPNIDLAEPVVYKVDIAGQAFDALYNGAELARDLGISSDAFVVTPSIAIDDVSQRLLMTVDFDGGSSLYWYNLLSKELTLLREDTFTEEVQTHSLSELDLDNQRVITGDWNAGLVKSIDLQTGEVQMIVADNDGREPELKSITSVALDAPGNRVLVADRTLKALVWVDLNSGEREVVSGLGVGEGPSFSFVDDIALDQENQRAFLRADNSVMMVNLISGDRVIVSN